MPGARGPALPDDGTPGRADIRVPAEKSVVPNSFAILAGSSLGPSG